MMTVSVDSRKFNDQLSALHDALVGSGQSSDIAALIKDEARLLLKEVLKFTLPLKKNTTSDRKQGEKAVSVTSTDRCESQKRRTSKTRRSKS